MLELLHGRHHVVFRFRRRHGVRLTIFVRLLLFRSKLVEDARYDSAIARAKRHRWLRSFTRSISFNTTRRAIENKKEERMSVKKMSRFLLFLKIEIGRKSFNLFYWSVCTTLRPQCELYSSVKSILVLVKHVAQIHVRLVSVFFVPLLEQFLALFVAFIPIDVHVVSRENAFALSSFRYVFSRKELDFVFFL